MNLDSVIPWGRSFAEYQLMFSLSEDALGMRILGCGDGPASFNATLTRRGGNVISVDPLYQFSATQIEARIKTVYPEVMSQLAATRENYNWETIENVAQLGKIRMQAMQLFLSDFEAGLKNRRYRLGELPELDFEDKQFDLALCSHYLFLYSEHLSLEEHLAGIKELCRVASEVRIYPLITLGGEPSPYLEEVKHWADKANIEIALRPTPYNFQKGATHFLVAKSTG